MCVSNVFFSLQIKKKNHMITLQMCVFILELGVVIKRYEANRVAIPSVKDMHL